MMKVINLIFHLIVAGCASTHGSTRIDEVIMYGGIDRSSIPKLNKGDEKFISKVVNEYGNKKSAAKFFIDQGFRFYNTGQYGMAIRRFNQAWLLDQTNLEVYHGFASITYDKGDNCGAMEYFDKAMTFDTSKLKGNEIGFLADSAMVISLCALEKDVITKAKLIQKSDALFSKAENIGETIYLYDKWGQVLYWQGKYKEAWQKTFKVNDLGGEVNPDFLEGLRMKMQEPIK